MSTSQIPFRVGHGYDIHRFAKGRKLFLGGVEIESEVGLEGHSDADAVLHAVCDAMLGAIGAGDIGIYFSPKDDRWKNCSSLVFLRECLRLVAENGWTIGNLDITILAEKPKVSAYYPKMRSVISEECGIPDDCVGIKATTNERMGCIGRSEGIAAFAVVLLFRIES